MNSAIGIPRVVVCGAVDDGKSTLIGRLLVDSGSVPLDEVSSITDKDGVVDFARLTDGLIAEREQGITIDVAFRYLRVPNGRRFLLADSPGHEEYTRNMAVAASSAQIAIILVDVLHGVREQTIRHATVCHLMGVRSFIFVLNKIDALDSRESLEAVTTRAREEIFQRVPVFSTSQSENSALASDSPRVSFVSISALRGDNVIIGEASLLVELEYAAEKLLDLSMEAPTRMPVQYVVKTGARRYYSGRLNGRPLKVGDVISVWPSGTHATIDEIFIGDSSANRAGHGESISIALDVEIDVSRGDIITSIDDVHASRAHLADLVWIGDDPLDSNKSYLLRCGPTTVPAHVPTIRYGYNLSDGTHTRTGLVTTNDITRVEVTTSAPLLLDSYSASRDTGGFILCDRSTGQTVAAGMTVEPLTRQGDVTKHRFTITRDVREEFNGLRAGVLWLTGLSGSGKSTIADALEAQLMHLGIRSYVLDGDSVRQSLSEDLGFSSEERKENIRRVARVAQLFMDAGIVTIVSLVSPFEADRNAARALFADEDFVEVFVDTPLNVCERRDPKGLYAEARASKSTLMTGIGQKYEAPSAPSYHLDGLAPAEDNAQLLRDWVVQRRIALS